jgi:hypothetical protein
MYYFFIGPVLLPITPSALTVDISGNNKVVTLINDIEINILHAPQLQSISFDVLLPTRATKYPFATYSLGGNEARAFTAYFRELQRQKIPFPFIIAKMKHGSAIPSGYENIVAVIDSFTQKEDSSNGLDVLASLKLKEYRDYSTIRVSATEVKDDKGETKTVYTTEKPRAKSYTAEINSIVNSVGLEVQGGFGI